MANQNRMIIQEAAGTAFDRLLASDQLRIDELVLIEGIPLQVSVARPIHACFSPREHEPWLDVAAGLKTAANQ